MLTTASAVDSRTAGSVIFEVFNDNYLPPKLTDTKLFSTFLNQAYLHLSPDGVARIFSLTHMPRRDSNPR